MTLLLLLMADSVPVWLVGLAMLCDTVMLSIAMLVRA